TFALNYRWGGHDPAGYHVVDLVLHVLCAVMLAVVVAMTLRLPYFGLSGQEARALAAVAALVWAGHPLASEAVVYVSPRTDGLAAVCYLTVLWAALAYWSATSSAARTAWVVVAATVSACGMATKEVMVSVPLAVLLFERTFLVDSLRATRRSWPLYASLVAG